MANIASNPWNFTSADPVTATPAASPTGLVLSGAVVNLTTTLAHGLSAGQSCTVFGATNAKYNGFYEILAVPTTTTAILIPQFSIAAGTSGSGGGTVALCYHRSQVRIEDISWQNASAAGQLLELRDRMGNIIWQATATGAGSQNRGKIFWVNGFTPVTIQSGVVIITVN